MKLRVVHDVLTNLWNSLHSYMRLPSIEEKVIRVTPVKVSVTSFRLVRDRTIAISDKHCYSADKLCLRADKTADNDRIRRLLSAL